MIQQDPIPIILIKQILKPNKITDNNKIMKNSLESKVLMDFINNTHIEVNIYIYKKVIVILNNFPSNKWKRCKDKLNNL